MATNEQYIEDDRKTPDTRVDWESERAGTSAMNIVAKESQRTRDALRNTLYQTLFKNVGFGTLSGNRQYQEAYKLRKEAFSILNDVEERDREPYQRQDAILDAARLSLSETDLARTTDKIHMLPDKLIVKDVKAKDKKNIDVGVTLTIDYTNPALKKIIDQDDLKTIAQKATPHKTILNWIMRRQSLASLQKNGITITGANFDHFDASQRDALAEKYGKAIFPYLNARKLFSAYGTSEMNVQTALILANEHPQAVIDAMTKSAGHAEEERDKAFVKVQLFTSIESLASQVKHSHQLDYPNVDAEIAAINTDLNEVKTGGSFDTTQVSEIGKKLRKRGSSITTDMKEIRKSLTDGLDALEGSIAKYETMESALRRIYQNAKKAGIETEDITKYFNPDGSFKKDELKSTTDPKIIADELQRAFKMGDKNALKADFEAKEHALHEIEHGVEPLSGREAILKAYEVYFQKQGQSPSAARKEALELYAENAFTRDIWRNAQNRMDRLSNSGKELQWMNWPGQQVKELLTGSQESFICHIAESPAIDLQRSMAARMYGPGKIFDATRTLGLFTRKHEARPGWGAMNYDQLMIAYYALRNAARSGDIVNTPYFRSQRDMVARLLTEKHIKKLVKATDSMELEKETREDLDLQNQQRKLSEDVQTMLEGEPPPAIQGKVTEAIDFAKRETGTNRKAIGRMITGTAKKTVHYGVVAPAKVATKVVTAPFRMIGSAAKSFWKWGMSTSGGSDSGGHDAHAGHDAHGGGHGH
jgi:hypothetical protein